MNKTELIKALSTHSSLTPAQAKIAVEALGICLAAELANGQSVKLPHVGTFRAQLTPQRLGRNPKTGAAMTIAEHVIVRFKASEALKTAVNHKPLLK